MDFRILYAAILTVLPFTELRAGLPIAITFALDNNLPVFPVSFAIILLNILVIFFVFWFLDNLHAFLIIKSKFYKSFFNKFLERFQKKVDIFERRYRAIGFIALVLFVAVPLPLTGAWSASLISWILDLDRKKSILSISLGVIIAGILVFLGTLGIINLFS